jgi:GxxExxY protein
VRSGTLIFREETYAVLGAAMAVYNHLRHGFLEAVYQEALELELAARRIPFKAQHELRIRYKAHLLKKTYTADLLVFDKIVVELKAIPKITSREEAQVLNYIRAADLPLGLVINFGGENGLEWKRKVF